MDRKFAALTLAVTGVLLYWSLFPFELREAAGTAGALAALAASFQQRPQRPDLLANILLYAPFGFLAVNALRRHRLCLLLVTAAGMGLSVAVELTQFYDRGRITSIWDVMANTGGTLLGAVLGYALHRQSAAHLPHSFRRRPYVILLLGCWLAYRFFPYVPSVDLHTYWVAVRPLFRSPTLPLLDLYRHTVIWLALALLLQALTGIAWSRLAFLLFVPLVEGIRVLIGTPLSAAEVVGGALAAAFWVAGLARLHGRALILAVLFTLVVILRGLTPFHFHDSGRAFEWVPFRGFLRGNIAVNIQVFLEKSFVYGILVWLWVRAGTRFPVAALGSAALVFGIGLAQVFLPGRSAELTDTAMLILTAMLLKTTAEDRHARRESSG